MKKMVVIALCLSMLLSGCGISQRKGIMYDGVDGDRPSSLFGKNDNGGLWETTKKGKELYDNISDVSSLITKDKANVKKMLASAIIKHYTGDEKVEPTICKDNYVDLCENVVVNTGNMLDYQITSQTHCIMLDTETFVFILGGISDNSLDGWVYFHDLYLGEHSFKRYDNGKFTGDKYVVDADRNLVGQGDGLNIEYTRSGYILTDENGSEWVLDLKNTILSYKSDDLEFSGSPYKFESMVDGIQHNFYAFNHLQCLDINDEAVFDGDVNHDCIYANSMLLGRVLQDVNQGTDINTVKADIISGVLFNAVPLFGALDTLAGGTLSEDYASELESDYRTSERFKGMSEEEAKIEMTRITDISNTITKFLQSTDEKSYWLYLHPDAKKVSKEEHDEYILQATTLEEKLERSAEIDKLIAEENQRKLDERLEEQRRKNEENNRQLQEMIDEKLNRAKEE